MDLKLEAAREAVTFIKDKSIVGLGAGSTILKLVELLANEKQNGLQITFLTSSFSTHQFLLQKGFVVQQPDYISRLDIYLDGCDQVDHELNALKSGGGIHTREKLLASMASQFLILGDESKYTQQFDPKIPLVIELLPQAFGYVQECIKKDFPEAKMISRISDKKDGVVITDNGNYLADIYFTQWPELKLIHPSIKSITGVVETSLFYRLAHKAILGGINGIKILEKDT